MASRNSRPFIPGSLKSLRTRSIASRPRIFRPVSASPAEKVVQPSSPRFSSSRRSIFGSSSTISTDAIALFELLSDFRPHKLILFTTKTRRREESERISSRRVFVVRFFGCGSAAPWNSRPVKSGRSMAPSPASVGRRRGGRCRSGPFRNRQEDAKTCAVPGLAFHAHKAAVLVHDLRNNGKPQADARLLRREKWIENLLAKLGRNAGTCVAKRDFDAVARAALCGRDLDAQSPAVRFHGLISVEREVLKDLLAETLVHRRVRKALRVHALDADLRLGALRGDRGQRSIHDLADVRGRAFERLRPREIEKPRHERA